MTDESEGRPSYTYGPREWFIGGLLVAVVGALVGAGIGGESDGDALASIGLIPGSLMIGIAVIAKAVEIGIKASRFD